MQKLQLLNKMIIAVLILDLNINTAFSQINLVTNPSFETLLGCPNYFGQIDSVTGWGILLNGGGGSPDLFNVCCTVPFICGVPLNSGNSSYQIAHNGNSYVGIEVARSSELNIREYFQSKLPIILSESSTYCVKFYVSLSNQSNAYVKPLGVHLDNGDIYAPPPYGLSTVTPQVYNISQQLNDTLNWMKIEGSFVATGNEEYITIGNFFPDSLSEIGVIGTPSFWFAYYYIDDVSVIDASLPAFAGNDTIILPGDSVFIGRQPEVGLNEDCIWFVNGTAIDTVAGMWVKPDSTTSYVLEQTICGNVSYDTVTVIVSGVGIEMYANGKGIKIFPNPNNGTFTISFNDKNSVSGTVEARISDILGNLISVINLELKNNIAIFDNNLSNGVYYFTVIDNKGNIYKTEKVIVLK